MSVKLSCCIKYVKYVYVMTDEQTLITISYIILDLSLFIIITIQFIYNHFILFFCPYDRFKIIF